MKNLTLENITKACQGSYRGPAQLAGNCISSVSTDSRKIEKDALFVAIAGERADGHSFIPDVMDKGALCALSERDLGEVAYPYILVESTLQAVKELAAYYLQQLQIPVLGITGSVGKTSTKEAIAAVLQEKYRTLKTKGNFNNELGLPLTIFRLREEDEIAVLEMGISNFGEMSRLAQIARPDTCVITNIGPCHLEFLGDRDGVLKAKTEIFDYMNPQGTVILNGDDDKLAGIEQVHGRRPMFFGLSDTYPVYADRIESQGLKGVYCRIHMKEEAFDVLIPSPGQHSLYNALAATAVGMTYGLTPAQIKHGLENLEPVSGRFRIVETQDHTIIDDCYNANPVSMKASLQVLQEALGRKVAVLGDMGELGADEQAMHNEVAAFAAALSLDACVFVGPLSTAASAIAREKNPRLRVYTEPDLDSLLDRMPAYLNKGDTILVKASHFMHFEKVVEALENK